MEAEKRAVDWENLSDYEKKRQLFIRQTTMLDTMLKTGAVSKEQYDISYNGLKQKMGFKD